MARETFQPGATSPSPLSSPTPSTVAAFAVRKDTSLPFAPSPAFRDVASPMSTSHVSLSTNPVHATLSPRPMSPAAYRIDHSLASHAQVPSSIACMQVNTGASSAKGSNNQHNPASANSQQSSWSTSSATPSADKVTERAFYRRILFQDLPTSTEAPSITHDVDLDHEILLLLAYLLRETVLPWYSKLTPDREFLTQVTSIITSIIHTIVQRQTSLPKAASANESDINAPRTAAELSRIHDLLSRDIPLILRQHCSDFRQAQSKADSVWAPLGTQQSSLATSTGVSIAEQEEQRRQQVCKQLPPEYRDALLTTSTTEQAASPLRIAQLFHAASPHPGLDPVTGSLDGKIDLAYLRIAVLNLLSSLLPADEFAPDTEKFIVRDVLVTVLRGALARSFRPWFFVQSIHKALDAAGWPSNPNLPSALVPDGDEDEKLATADNSPPSADLLSAAVGLLARLPAIILKVWTLIFFTALPFLVHAYLDIFNVQRAATRRKRHQLQQKEERMANHECSSSSKGTFPSSMSMGSLYERKMHGRFPSRKFQFSHDDTITAQVRSLTIDGKLTLTQADLARAQSNTGAGGTELNNDDVSDEEDLARDYVGNWLDAVEELLQASSHLVLRVTFGFARTILGTTGLDESINRMAVRKINSELSDTQKLAKMVHELRRILLPDGHLPPSVPDPDKEMQEAEWIRLRTRLVCGSARPPASASGTTQNSEDAMVPWLVKKMLLGCADVGIRRGDRAWRVQDTQIQLQRLTSWLEPFCSPQAAGPNTLLAILLFERVVVALSPDLTLA
ncbi:uncharacterized protein UBRO_02890 [Ustilago bromivora]|uniref:PXA domain-containing protein n=1 Tax=Ustilago bromivora TaxID=307758 RepID=A0A1K0HB29_9BASI|nr:uncharacterized protein UBRO_02890 [Ustilago bromivora]SYW77863.1 uncharacterized protein UBRO2_02055 [Ustilago bromivora]